MQYTPRIGSLAAKVCAWLKAHSGGQIDSERVCHLFSATASNVAAQLGAAEDADYLVSERRGRVNVYRAGPALASWEPSLEDARAAVAPAVATPPSQPKRRSPPQRLACMPSDLVIEDNVPLSAPKGGRGTAGVFDATFAALKVGQSFARPHAEAKALKDSADRWSKRNTASKTKFAVRRESETHSRVWRTE